MLALCEHGVNAIGSTTIKRCAALHADAVEELLRWNKAASQLIVKVDYRAKLLMVKEFLTHKEYTRGGWKKWAR